MNDNVDGKYYSVTTPALTQVSERKCLKSLPLQVLLYLQRFRREVLELGVKVDPSKCEVDVDQVTNWQRTEHTKLDVSQFVEDIARIVAKDLKKTDDETKKRNDVASLLEQVKLIIWMSPMLISFMEAVLFRSSFPLFKLRLLDNLT